MKEFVRQVRLDTIVVLYNAEIDSLGQENIFASACCKWNARQTTNYLMAMSQTCII